MKTWALLLIVLILGSMTFGQTDCPNQTYMALTGYPIVLDQSKIALGPADANGVQKPLLLNITTIALGQTAQDKIRACDQDGDAFQLRCEEGTLTPVPNTTQDFTWSWKPSGTGIFYLWVEVQDVRPETNDSLITRGTEVVVVLPKNRPVTLCGGQLRSL